MSLRLLKSRPKPNITSRRKPLNGENHEVSKPPEVQLSKNEEEIKVLLEASTNKISNSDQSIPSKDTVVSEQANSINDDKNTASELSTNNLNSVKSVQINNENEKKKETSGQEEVVLPAIALNIQEPHMQVKVSSDGGNERKLKVRPKPNIGIINRRRPCLTMPGAELISNNDIPFKPTQSTENINDSEIPLITKSECSKEFTRNVRDDLKTKTEECLNSTNLPMKQEVQTVSNCGLPVRKKFCPNVVKSNRLQKKDSKQINNSLTSDLKPEKLLAGDETIKNNVKLGDKVDKTKSPSSGLKSGKEEIIEKVSSEKVIQSFNASTKIVQRNYRVKVNPNVTEEPTGKKTLRMKILKDEGNGKKAKRNVAPEKQKKREEILNKLLGKETSEIPEDGVHVSFELDSSDESSLADSNEVERVTDSSNSVGRGSPLVSSPCRSSRMNNVKPNLTSASSRLNLFNQPTYGQLSQDANRKFRMLFGNNSPERSKMSVKDLIFYNPKRTNVPGEMNKNKFKMSDRDDNRPLLNADDSETVIGDVEVEEGIVNIDANQATDENGIPVPQLKLNANGEIVIAPESLVVKTKDETAKKEWRPLIVENDFTHHKIMKKKCFGEKRNWSFQETLKFYKILQSTGSDFSTMATEFPDRSRNGLKRKFKREEKLNGHLIDRILPNNVVTDEIFENVEKELAVNKMWGEIERCYKRRSDILPEIPDITQGVTDDMFLSTYEKKAMKKKGSSKPPDNPLLNSLLEEDSKANNSKTKPNKRKPKVKRKVFGLREYISKKDDSSSPIQPSLNALMRNSARRRNVTEVNRPASDDEVIITVDEDLVDNKPIVVNTSIESSGIKYTKSITFNPSNLDNPVDINETISHNSQQGSPSSSEIIDEIVNILSTDNDLPSEHNLENESKKEQEVIES
ncbi:transcription factor TFIIIB component B'' homolog Bdp1 [Rhodnius prolixus]|uniref:transcription factor TFIIIB component B'' homolog Bdp1 n=1 Tax=Rhodnius prolixus TaxID=13249 RepID=UPI003D18B839